MRTPWRRLRAAWITLTGTGAAASVAFGLLVLASVLASLAIPRDSTGLRTGALRHTVAASPLDSAVVGTIGLLTASETFGQSAGESPGPEIAAIGARLRSRLAATGMPIASDPPAWSSLTSGYGPVTGAARAAGRGQPQFEVTYRTALSRYSDLVTGRLPSAGQGAVVPGRGDRRHRGQVRPAGRHPPQHGPDGAAGDHGDHPAGTPGGRLLD